MNSTELVGKTMTSMCSNSDSPQLPPPSLHMRLGCGLSNRAKSQRCVSCFDDDIEQPSKRIAISESDLLSLFDMPTSQEDISLQSKQLQNRRSSGSKDRIANTGLEIIQSKG